MWAPVCIGLAVGGEHGVVEFQGRSGNHTRQAGMEPAESLSNSLFMLVLECLEVSGRLGLGQRVMGAQVYMEAIIEVGNSLGFNPNFLTFLLCDLEHITSLCQILNELIHEKHFI